MVGSLGSSQARRAPGGTGPASMVRRSAATWSGDPGLGQDVALEVDAGRDLGDGDAVGQEPHDAALGDVGDVLPLLDGAPAAERDVLDLGHELLDLALARDLQAAVLDARAWRRP